MITKDQASDLRSAIENARLRALERQETTLASEQADRQLEGMLWRLEHENK